MGQEETKGLGSVFFVFAGYVLSVTAFVVGGNVGNQLNFANGALALFIGNMVLAVYSGIIGIIGMKCKRSSTDIFKPVFGVKGQVITSTIVSLFTLVFVSVYSSLVGLMAASLFPGISPYIGLIVYIAILLFINLKGFKGMSIFSKIGVPAIALFVIYGIITVINKSGFTSISESVPVTPMPFFTVVSVVTASWMTGATFSSDLTRFVKKTSYVWLITIGSFLFVTILESVGLVCALVTGQSDLVTIFSDLNMSAIAFTLYLLLTITSGQAIVYISSLAMSNITKVIRNVPDDNEKYSPRRFIIPSCIFAGIVGVIMTIAGFTSTFLSFLGVIGLAIPPVGGTLVGHFFFVEKEYIKTFENMPAFRGLAFVAWIVGILASKFMTFGITSLNGFLVSMIVYAVFRKITNRKKVISK